ncbi:alpha/beta fold hydrolase [Lishizhenia sp.]|uniref:alpha/beta fold hydrolase n=1 Tax=Lishizhenia sp. TaxID=2497594 RepID=UPI00299DCECE|nr:alpha/beta fold hydrolase [Lishizhenia sp.]MDX1445239.1 alpha/beta fold hydrolase [Lishizhenia sp.]
MKLHYRKMGEGAPFIILHGLFGSSDNWQTHAKRLSEYFEVYLVDQRNHGHSDWSDAFNYDLLAEDLKELIDDEGIEDAYILGHSMGGKTAMFFAQKYPELIEKLIVVDMGIKSYPSHHGPILEGLNALDLDVIKTRGAAAKEMAKYVENEATRMFLLKNLYWKEKGQLGWRINIPVLEAKMSEILVPLPKGECFVPTLFMRGGLSGYILEEDYDSIHEAFPDSEIRTIENAGHWIHAEAPKEFMDEVLGYCLR